MDTKNKQQSRYWLKLGLAILGGAAAGFLYYRFVGCVNGTCPISGNPLISTLYGGTIGLVLGLGFLRK